MGESAENKTERILSMYTRLKQGQVIYTEKESDAFGVDPRTIRRDISCIRNFLHNQRDENGEEQDVIPDKVLGGHRLVSKKKDGLKADELLAVCKILLESRALIKEELFPILDSLLESCGTKEESKTLKGFIANEMHHYIELQHGKKLLDDLWKLESAIKEQRYLEITYKKVKNEEEVVRKVKPVGVMFSEYYFYLTAYIENIDKEKEFQNPNDPFPTIYRVDRLTDIQVLEEHFKIPYRDRFEEGEFRKRIQFMYGGRLRRIKFKYMGNSPAAILDKLPTAKIIGKDEEGMTFQAEVFGEGFDRWIRTLGDEVTEVESRLM